MLKINTAYSFHRISIDFLKILVLSKPDTVIALKTTTPWGMKRWPSYRGGRLIEVILLGILMATLNLGNARDGWLKGWPSWKVLLYLNLDFEESTIFLWESATKVNRWKFGAFTLTNENSPELLSLYWHFEKNRQ